VIGLWDEATLRVIGYLFSSSRVPVSMAIVVVGYRRDRDGETSRGSAGVGLLFRLWLCREIVIESR
jgi:hypothetical protein